MQQAKDLPHKNLVSKQLNEMTWSECPTKCAGVQMWETFLEVKEKKKKKRKKKLMFFAMSENFRWV